MPKPPVKRIPASTAAMFAALGDTTRLMLLQRLSQGGPASISILADRFHLTRQGVTKHLKVLAAAHIIDGHRAGREHIWALNLSRLTEARRHLDLITNNWDEALTRLKALTEYN